MPGMKKGIAPEDRRKPQKSKDEVQVLRKTLSIRIARVILWIILAFFFARGLITMVKPRAAEDFTTQLQASEEQLALRQQTEAGLLPFAEDFARDYLTYTQGGDADYKERLSRYALSGVLISTHLDGGDAAVQTSTAYRQSAYSDTQYDVWVRLSVVYTSRNGEDSATNRTELVTLKVPVAAVDDAYIVEDLPAFVANESLPEYDQEAYSGVNASREVAQEITEALTNFFTAYYGEEQSVIRYYLVPEAKEANFAGLHGQMKFMGIDSAQSFVLSGNNYLSLVTLTLETSGGQQVTQRYNMQLRHEGAQYYIAEMNTRTKNINQ